MKHGVVVVIIRRCSRGKSLDRFPSSPVSRPDPGLWLFLGGRRWRLAFGVFLAKFLRHLRCSRALAPLVAELEVKARLFSISHFFYYLSRVPFPVFFHFEFSIFHISPSPRTLQPLPPVTSKDNEGDLIKHKIAMN